MKTKYLVCVFIILIGLCACNDEEALINSGQRPQHTMRVKKITGYNEHWKDYTLEITYVNDKVAGIERFNKKGRKMGELVIDRGQGQIVYYLLDYVPRIDSDSIARLDVHLETLHGAGNYSLEDSIPLISTVLMELSLTTADGCIESQQFTYYQPKTDFGTGVEFSPSYDMKSREIFVYEYGEGSNVLVCRNLVDSYKAGTSQSYTRVAYKTEYGFGGDQVKESVISMAGDEYENSWKMLEQLSYTYSGQDLVSITGNAYSLQRNYSAGKLVSIVENGITTTYSMNDQNYCVRIEKSNGNVMNIEYESGGGDFEIFSRVDKIQQGYPVIW